MHYCSNNLQVIYQLLCYTKVLIIPLLLVFVNAYGMESNCEAWAGIEGDAIYCVHSDYCQGSENVPLGLACPVVGSKSVLGCARGHLSYVSQGICITRNSAVCRKSPIGVWRCVWKNSASDTPDSEPVIADIRNATSGTTNSTVDIDGTIKNSTNSILDESTSSKRGSIQESDNMSHSRSFEESRSGSSTSHLQTDAIDHSNSHNSPDQTQNQIYKATDIQYTVKSPFEAIGVIVMPLGILLGMILLFTYKKPGRPSINRNISIENSSELDSEYEI